MRSVWAALVNKQIVVKTDEEIIACHTGACHNTAGNPSVEIIGNADADAEQCDGDDA